MMDADVDDLRRHVVQASAFAGITLILCVINAVTVYAVRFDKVPQHTSILSGQHWIDELIAGHNG